MNEEIVMEDIYEGGVSRNVVKSIEPDISGQFKRLLFQGCDVCGRIVNNDIFSALPNPQIILLDSSKRIWTKIGSSKLFNYLKSSIEKEINKGKTSYEISIPYDRDFYKNI
jgi:hypothetical protein